MIITMVTQTHGNVSGCFEVCFPWVYVKIKMIALVSRSHAIFHGIRSGVKSTVRSFGRTGFACVACIVSYAIKRNGNGRVDTPICTYCIRCIHSIDKERGTVLTNGVLANLGPVRGETLRRPRYVGRLIQTIP